MIGDHEVETKAEVFAALLADWLADEYQIDSEWGDGTGTGIAVAAEEWRRRYEVAA